MKNRKDIDDKIVMLRLNKTIFTACGKDTGYTERARNMFELVAEKEQEKINLLLWVIGEQEP